MSYCHGCAKLTAEIMCHTEHSRNQADLITDLRKVFEAAKKLSEQISVSAYIDQILEETDRLKYAIKNLEEK